MYAFNQGGHGLLLLPDFMLVGWFVRAITQTVVIEFSWKFEKQQTMRQFLIELKACIVYVRPPALNGFLLLDAM